MEKPILFSAPMVRAILEGRKTMTRRILKPQPDSIGGKIDALFKWHIGDRLWVRETFCCHSGRAPDPIKEPDLSRRATAILGNGEIIFTYYKADCDKIPLEHLKWKPSIHMPRWASRITLEVTGVKVHRLQDISRGDAMEGGCPFPNMANGTDPRDWFADIWQSSNGNGSWQENPWVVAVSFKRVLLAMPKVTP